jgi:radical SAM protein with 4Fe4S-binding SPASM domain
VPKVEFAISEIVPWDQSQLMQLKEELGNLRNMLLYEYKKTGRIPLYNNKKNTERGIFVCNAGKNRFAIAPDGSIWGCSLFADYFKGKNNFEESSKYCFGDLNSFIKNHKTIYPEIQKHVSELRMDRYFTPQKKCVDCEYLNSCGACPADNLIACSDVNKISWWGCEIKKTLIENKRQFWAEIQSQA